MEFIRTLDVTFEVSDAARLTIENRSGTVTVRGDGGRTVRVEVVARLWAEDDDEADDQLELIRRGIQRDGDRVAVRTPALLRPRPFLIFGHSRPKVDYQITVPERTQAQIDNHSGPVEVTSIEGPLRVGSRSGKVSLQDVAKTVECSSRSGSIQAESIGGALDAQSRSGSIKVRGCRGDISVEARSGSIQIEDAGGRLTARTRSGSVRYEGGVHGSFDIDVTSGSVRLKVDPNSRFFLDAEAVSGSVTSDVRLHDRADGGRPPKDAARVRIRTVSGSIHISTY